MAALLYRGLSKKHELYYLGYPTDYIRASDGGNALFLPGAPGETNAQRRPGPPENRVARMVYNLVFNRMMVGMDRSSIAISVSALMPDVIISNSISDFTLLTYLRRRGIRFRSVYIDHASLSTTTTSYLSRESIPLTVGSGINSITLDGAKRRFFNFFDMNVALNAKQEKEMLRFTDRVTKIANGIKIGTAVGPSSLAAARRRYAIRSGDFVVLYIGRMLERQKRVSSLIKAFRSIRGGRARLLLAGSGPSLRDYRKLAGGDRRITFCGALAGKKVAEVYSISDLFVLPSAWEGLTLTTLEACQFGLPVVLSDDAYSADLRVGGAPLLHFRTGDHEALASLIQGVMRDEKSRKSAIEASKRLSRAFSEERMLKNYEDLIGGI